MIIVKSKAKNSPSAIAEISIMETFDCAYHVSMKNENYGIKVSIAM